MTIPARTPGSLIPVRDVPNLRDLGGWPTTDGRTVRYGRVYRSTDLTRIRPTSLADLGLRTVLDLRTEGERTTAPDRPVPGAELVTADVLADSRRALPADIPRLLADPQALQAALSAVGPSGRTPAELIADTYRDLVRSDAARTGYRQWLDLVAEDDAAPLLVHCTTGKDRTGWAAALLLLALGVPRETVEQEYLLTNRDLLPTFEPLLRPFAEDGGDRSLLEAVLGVDLRYLHAALDEVDTRYGSIEGYLTDGLVLDAAVQQRLRDLLLEPAVG